MNLTIKEVASRKDLREFAAFPNRLYKGNPWYVPQIVSMDMDTLDPKKNRAFEVCEGKYWLAIDEQGKTVGRVAGIINHKYNEKIGRKQCRFGWIDFIEDKAVAAALLAKVEEYAREKGMDEVEGPTGFLEFDVAGVLVEGYDRLPTPYGKYNAPYYEPFILEDGYSPSTDYVEFIITIPDEVPENIRRMSRIVSERFKVREAPIRRKKDILKYADGVFACLNRCYSKIHGFSELSPGQCEDLKKQFFGNLRKEFVSIIIDENDTVVAFGITLPSLAKAMQKAKGSLYPFGFIPILRALRKNDTIDALLIAVDDGYKDKGINAMMIDKILSSCNKAGIKWMESTRELADNHEVQNLWGRFGCELVKRARIYSKRV